MSAARMTLAGISTISPMTQPPASIPAMEVVVAERIDHVCDLLVRASAGLNRLAEPVALIPRNRMLAGSIAEAERLTAAIIQGLRSAQDGRRV